MTASGATRWRTELEAIAAELATLPVGAARAAAEARLADLGRRVRDQLEQLRLLQDEIRAVATGTSTTGRAPVRVDHLGASTFAEKGWHALARDEPEQAVAAFQEALRLAPGHPEAEALLGWALAAAGQLDQAGPALDRALARRPPHPMARVGAGLLHLRRRDFGAAIGMLTASLRDPTDRKAVLYAQYLLGVVYLERGMLADARQFLQAALDLGPNLHEAACHLGRVEWLAGRHDEARRVWARAAAAAGSSPWTTRLAELAGRPDDAGPP